MANRVIVSLIFCIGLATIVNITSYRGFANEESELPRITKNATEFDTIAQKAFQQLLKTMQKALDDPLFSVELVKFTDPKEATNIESFFNTAPADMAGFVHSASYRAEKPTVFYQNIYELSDRAIEINKQVTQVDSKEKLIPHCELMLYWYLAHELVHAAREFTNTAGNNKWYEEFVANTVQPYLSDSALTNSPNAPYTPHILHLAYNRSVKVLSKVVNQKILLRTELFITSEGHVPPCDTEAWTMFRTDVPAYVYIGARVTQASVDNNTSLEKLVEKYLKK